MELPDVIAMEPPWDCESERQALGSLFLAERVIAVKMQRLLRSEEFFDGYHAWTWDRVRFAIHSGCDWRPGSIAAWAGTDGWSRKAKQKWNANLAKDIASWMDETGFHWHWRYYCERVKRTAALRRRIYNATSALSRELDTADSLRHQHWGMK